MRFKPLLAALLMVLPAPALADITARYDAHGSVFAVEVDDGGNARAGIDGKFALIRRDGVNYVVIYSPDGAPHVARADAVLARMAEVSKPPEKWRVIFTAQGKTTVAGYPGTIWRFGPVGDPPVELVMSADPALAPIGGVFRSAADTLAVFIKAQVNDGSDPVEDVRSLFSHGTPIRLRKTSNGADMLTLQSVGTAEIDSHRFDLPAPVMTAQAFVAAITPPSPPKSPEPMIQLDPPAPPKP